MNFFSRRTAAYTLCGVVIGSLIPVLATIFESHAQLQTFSMAGLQLQVNIGLLWLMLAPLLVGLLAFFLGRQADALSAQEKQLQHVREQMLVQEKMATLGQMTARIAHEIKNPLNFITNFAEGSVEICEELLNSTKEIVKNLPLHLGQELTQMVRELKENSIDIKQNGIRINEIITTIMARSRGAKQQKKLTDIKDLIQQYLNLANQSFKSTHSGFTARVEKDFQTSENMAFVNPSSLGRVLLNMFHNALYALHQKQNVSESEFKPILEIETKVHVDELSIIIRDNGGGINPEVVESIFNPFFSTKPTGQGNTGLGLAICKDIVENEHGGTIGVRTAPGKSTEFSINIPFDQRADTGIPKKSLLAMAK